jgi:hypothetical protein
MLRRVEASECFLCQTRSHPAFRESQWISRIYIPIVASISVRPLQYSAGLVSLLSRDNTRDSSAAFDSISMQIVVLNT